VLPDGVESVEKADEPAYSRVLPLPLNTVALETVDAQTRAPDCTAQLPLEDFRVKPPPLAVTVKVAQVPEVYQVPPEMMQPFWAPPLTTLRKPEPAKLPEPVPPVEVGWAAVVVAVLDGGGVLPDLGRYLMPVLGQVELEPMGSEGW
jgi:hypothetical protein